MAVLIDKYGYLAILVGTFLEGGTLLSMGGFLAHQGYLLIPGVVLAGAAGNFVDTLVFYFIGRRSGPSLGKRRPAWQAQLERLHARVRRRRSLMVIGLRFAPGVRTVGAAALGAARVPLGLFLMLNAVGALLWASLIAAAGYLSGHLLQALVGDIKHLEVPILLAIAVLGALAWLGSARWRRRAGRRG